MPAQLQAGLLAQSAALWAAFGGVGRRPDAVWQIGQIGQSSLPGDVVEQRADATTSMMRMAPEVRRSMRAYPFRPRSQVVPQLM